MNISRVKTIGAALMLSLGVLSSYAAHAQTANCEYNLQNDWGSGATASIDITNVGSQTIEDWAVEWGYDSDRVTSSWNANVSGDNPYSATGLDWNADIQPGETVSFGLQIQSNGSPETPAITGDVCGDAVSSSSSSASSVSANSSENLSSSNAASSCPQTGGTCN